MQLAVPRLWWGFTAGDAKRLPLLRDDDPAEVSLIYLDSNHGMRLATGSVDVKQLMHLQAGILSRRDEQPERPVQTLRLTKALRPCMQRILQAYGSRSRLLALFSAIYRFRGSRHSQTASNREIAGASPFDPKVCPADCGPGVNPQPRG